MFGSRVEAHEGTVGARRRLPGRMALVAVAALVAIPIVSQLSGADASPAAGDPAVEGVAAGSPEVPPSVAVVGDSLVFQTADEQRAALRDRGHVEVTVFGDPGQPMTAPTIGAHLDAALDADVVVIATASNDNVANAIRADEVGQAQALAEYHELLDRTLDRFDGRCVVLVDVRDVSSELYRTSFAPQTNSELRRVAAERPHTVVVAWSDLSRAHGDDWFVGDRLHFDSGTERRQAGADAYADAVVDGVAGCGA